MILRRNRLRAREFSRSYRAVREIIVEIEAKFILAASSVRQHFEAEKRTKKVRRIVHECRS